MKKVEEKWIVVVVAALSLFLGGVFFPTAPVAAQDVVETEVEREEDEFDRDEMEREEIEELVDLIMDVDRKDREEVEELAVLLMDLEGEDDWDEMEELETLITYTEMTERITDILKDPKRCIIIGVIELKNLAIDSDKVEEGVKHMERVLDKAKDPWVRNATHINLMELYVETDQPEKAVDQIRRMIDENLEALASK